MNEIEEKQKQQTIALYKQCFSDDDAFVDFYFSNRYLPENNVCITQNGNVVAALQIINYEMTFCNQLISVAYLSAICTHPNYRKQGLMTTLLRKTFQLLYKRGVCLATLIPADAWLFDVYQKFDFRTIFFRHKKTIDIAKIELKCDLNFEALDSNNFIEICTYANKKMESKPMCLLHSLDDYKIVCKDIENSGGHIIAARRNKNIVGVAYELPINGTPTVVECFAENEDVKNLLFQEFSKKIGSNTIEYISVAENCDLPFGMARVICANKLLDIFAHAYTLGEKEIMLKDDFLPENNAYFYIKSGTCKIIKSPKTINACNMQTLLNITTSHQNPYMSLMMNE